MKTQNRTRWYVSNIGIIVRAHREGAGWSQRDLSIRSGISQQTISAIENGRRSMSFDVFIQLCVVMRVDPNTLIDWGSAPFNTLDEPTVK